MNNEKHSVLKPVLMLALALAAAGLLFPACSRDEAVVRVSCDDFYRESLVARQMVVPAGSSFRVGLCGNPSPVWEWPDEAAISDDSLIVQTGHKSTMIPLGGAPGQEIWTFHTLERGTGRIIIQADCPLDSDVDAIWRLELDVTID